MGPMRCFLGLPGPDSRDPRRWASDGRAGKSKVFDETHGFRLEGLSTSENAVWEPPGRSINPRRKVPPYSVLEGGSGGGGDGGGGGGGGGGPKSVKESSPKRPKSLQKCVPDHQKSIPNQPKSVAGRPPDSQVPPRGKKA